MSFEDLVAHRQQLQRFCEAHYKSLTKFQDGISFKIHISGPPLNGEARHLSSTATCIDSLSECPHASADWKRLGEQFAGLALKRPSEDWKSDGSAQIYCRCRTLPVILKCLSQYEPKVTEHLKSILNQLTTNPERFAIGEASSSSLLSTDDLLDTVGLVKSLNEALGPLSTHLKSQLSTKTLEGLPSHSATDHSILNLLVRDFNTLLEGSALYEETLFEGIQLRPETKDLLKRNPEGDLLIYLNRLLLEDAYPKLISRRADEKKDWYASNAFHTYWTLEIIDMLESRFPKEYAGLVESLKKGGCDLLRIRSEMLLWAKQTAGYQMALHNSKSSTLDSDQLAWALAITMRFSDDLQANLGQQDFIREGLNCLFKEQTPNGIWRTGAPLFHYKNSGNAHCYIFETFSILLKTLLLNRDESIFLREILRPYAPQLLRLWTYAKSTKIPLPGSADLFGWSSGHRVNRKEAESWATASVYSFTQCLRRLIGIWARGSAAEQLKIAIASKAGEDALPNLAKRGETWIFSKHGQLRVSHDTAGDQLITLFVNPVRCFGSGDRLEPDGFPIADDQARAAILFGPPGTSKTTLSRSVANAIGWDYVELHASHFVADGLPNVQRTADKLFDKLLQLDRTVILFDEIDELVRARDMGADAFGRFLTTSMLPKLAELWKRRKVIYFVATNHIEFFDSAIIRAERFDALIHVAPPSFQRKVARLQEILNASITFSDFNGEDVETAVNKALESTPQSKAERADMKLPGEFQLAKFVLLRWDQIPELASNIHSVIAAGTGAVVTKEIMTQCLQRLSDSSLNKLSSYSDYIDGYKYETHDFSKVKVYQVKDCKQPNCSTPIHSAHSNIAWYVTKAPLSGIENGACAFHFSSPGVVECLGAKQLRAPNTGP